MVAKTVRSESSFPWKPSQIDWDRRRTRSTADPWGQKPPGQDVMFFVQKRRFFVRHAFVFKTAVRELYFSKKFCSVNYNKIFFVFVLPCKKCSFSRFVQQKISCPYCFVKPKIIVFVFVKTGNKQRRLRTRVWRHRRREKPDDRRPESRQAHRPVHGDNGGRLPAWGKGAGRPGPADSLARPERRFPLPMFPASDCCKDWTHSLLFVETGFFSRLPLLSDSFGFLEGTGPSPSYPLWTVSTSLPRIQDSFVFLHYICRRRILYAAPADTFCRIWLTSSWIFPHPSLSVRHHCAPIPRKGSGSTTTILQECRVQSRYRPIYRPLILSADIWLQISVSVSKNDIGRSLVQSKLLTVALLRDISSQA